MLGASIPAGLADSFANWWPSLLCMFAVMLLGGWLHFTALRRIFGFPRMDAALCAMPGGISEMILLGEQAGADQRRVAIVHALRIALSILIIPLVAGLVFGITVGSSGDLPPVQMSPADWLWFGLCVLSGVAADRWTRLPIPLILVPLVVSAALHLSGMSAFHVPPVIAIAIQVMIGINVGARFLGVSPYALAHVALAACMVAGMQMALAVAAALVMAATGRWDALALMLAYAPGGLAENHLRETGESGPLVQALGDWLDGRASSFEFSFRPNRLLMHDTTCTPALADIAGLRDAVAEAAGDPRLLTPQLPVEVSVDHSLAVDLYGSAAALARNSANEIARNRERYGFMKWASANLAGVHVNPPGTGIMHTINLEQLATVLELKPDGSAHPDMLLGTDSHTPMINGIGVMGWGSAGWRPKA